MFGMIIQAVVILQKKGQGRKAKHSAVAGPLLLLFLPPAMPRGQCLRSTSPELLDVHLRCAGPRPVGTEHEYVHRRVFRSQPDTTSHEGLRASVLNGLSAHRSVTR